MRSFAKSVHAEWVTKWLVFVALFALLLVPRAGHAGSSETSAAFTATQLVRQFTLRNTVSQVNQGLQGFVSDQNGVLRGLPMSAALSFFPADMGTVPTGYGVPTRDGGGRPLGYCAWDNSSSTPGGGFNAGLGASVPLVYAVVSAGLNGAIETSCAQILATRTAAGDDYIEIRQPQQTASQQYRSSVATYADLLATQGADGDVRLVRESNRLYTYSAGSWVPVSSGPTFSDDSASNGTGAVSYTAGKVTVAEFQATVANFSSNLTVAGSSTFSGAVTASNGITVTAGGAKITGNSEITGNLAVSGALTAATLAGDGSALTNLNAANISSGVLGNAFGGTGLNTSAAANGQLLIGNGAGFNLASLAGTAGQINVINGPGFITLSLPQSIATTSTPTFGGLTLSGAMTGTSAVYSADISARRLGLGDSSGGVSSLNLVVGNGAMSGAQSGSGANTAVGISALASNSSGNTNTALGYQALQFNQTGSSSVAIGWRSLRNNTTGGLLTAIGPSAMASSTTIFESVAIGASALEFANDPYQVAVGNSALGSLTTGRYNAVVGHYAMPSLTNGADNVAVGGQTGNNLTTGNGNVFLGRSAGFSFTSGGNNTMLGSNANVTGSTSLNYATAIGSGANVSTSSTLVLGRTTDKTVIGATGTASSGILQNKILQVTGDVGITGNLSIGGAFSAASFSGDGSGLTNLNASNISTGTLGVARGGTGVNGSTAANGQLLIGNGTGYTLANITGTANQVNVTNGAGSITLSLPQSIATTSTPTFGGLTLTGALGGTAGTFAGDLTARRLVLSDVSGGVSNPNVVIGAGALNGVPSGAGGNVAIGTNAMASNTSGGLNVAVGHLAMSANTTGYLNTAVGMSALVGNTTGNYNTAVGADALYSNTTGSDNSAFGAYALTSNTTGYQNTAMGGSALYANTTGYGNSAYGYNSLLSNTAGYANTAAGYNALNLNTTGNQNTATGYKSLEANTTGNQNTATGYRSLTANSTGSENAAVGVFALTANTTGYQNSALGAYALSSNTTGYGNSAMGYSALWSNSTGYANTAAGYNALNLNTTGDQNTATGYKSLEVNTTGYQNTATGYRSLTSNTTGDSNTATGFGTLQSSTTGVSNTAVGHSALAANTTGTRNTGMGAGALGGNTTGQYNSALGRSAGYRDYFGSTTNANTTGDFNTFLGAYAMPGTSTQLDHATAIGAEALVTTSGTLVLGRTTDKTVIGATGTASSGILQNKILQVTGDVGVLGNLSISGAFSAASFSGNGSGLTNLNASNISSGTLGVARGGTGVDGSAAANGQLLIGNGTGYTLANITGTANQVNVTNGAGSITLSLPQSIATTSTPTFGGLTLATGGEIQQAGAAGAPGTPAAFLRSTTFNANSWIFRESVPEWGIYHYNTDDISPAANSIVLTSPSGSGWTAGLSSLPANTAAKIILSMATGNGLFSGKVGVGTNTPSANLDVVGTGAFTGAVTASSFSGNGSALTNLNASNISTGTLSVARGGTGVDGSTAANGRLLIGNGSGYTLANITGTANQVNVANGAGSITLSLPQSIATTSTPTFAGLTLTGGVSAGGLVQIATNNELRFGAFNEATDPVYIKRVNPAGDQSLLRIAIGDNPADFGGGGTDELQIGYTSNDHTAFTPVFRVAGNGSVISSGTITASTFAGNGSALTNLNAGNISSGVLGVANGGTGLNGSAAAPGQLLVGNGSGYTLANITGTANQVNVTNGAGSITLSLPQNIATTSTPTFGGLTVNGGLSLNGGLTLTGGLTGTTANLSGTVTLGGLVQIATNNELRFGAFNEATDPVYIKRVNPAGDQSLLRIAIGDNPADFGGGITDELQIGYTSNDHTAFTPTFRVAGNGSVISSGTITASNFAGNGSALTNLNASNISSGTLGVARGGTGVDGSAAANGQLLIGNGTGYTLANITGTTNQVNVTNGAGSITLSLPQSIATTSTPTFGGLSVNGDVGVTGKLSSNEIFANSIKGRSLAAFCAVSSDCTAAAVVSSQGAYLQWNRVPGSGQTYLVNQRGIGTGGISFGEAEPDNTYTQNMAISRAGNLTVRNNINAVGATFTGAVTASSFAGNGSALTNLNAGNISSGVLGVANGGTGLNGSAAAPGQLLIGNGSGYTLASITGTANQVNVTNGAGSITLSLPQSIATTSTPTFGGLTLSGALTGSTATFSGNVSLPSDTSSLIFPQVMTAGTPTRDILVVSPGYDGFALRQVENFNGVSGQDWMVFDKTDFNHSTPDGGIAFSNTGTGGTVYSLAITGSGNIGMGTLTPTSKLHVVGTANVTGNTTVGGTLTSTGLMTANAGLQVATGQELRFGTLNDNSDAMFISRVNAAVDQSILRVSAFQDLDDFGGAYADEFQIGASPLDRSSFTPLFRMAGSGNVIISGNVTATAFTATSDRRLKTDITPVGDDMLTKLSGLNAYQYRFINNPSLKYHYGVIAQELQTVFPHAVSTNSNGMLSVDYGALGALAAVGVGRLNSQLKILDDTVQTQGKKLGELGVRVDQIDDRVKGLEDWKTSANTRMDTLQKAIDVNVEKIAENALKIAANTEKITALDDAMGRLDKRVGSTESRLAKVETTWSNTFSVSDDGSTLTIQTPNLVVSNLTAETLRAKAAYTERLEAEMARIRSLEVDSLRANTATARNVKAEVVNTGSAEVYAGAGMPAFLFAAPADGHYTVNTSAMDGSYATATVIVNAGQVKVIPIKSEGIDLIGDGNTVKALAAGKMIRASWIKMG